MKLIIEPDAGVRPLLAAIKSAKKSVEIAIFRFDRRDVEIALKAAAAAKGVGVIVSRPWVFSARKSARPPGKWKSASAGVW